MVLMLQKKLPTATPPNTAQKTLVISIFLQSAYHIHNRHLVAASRFYPEPKVDSVLLRLD